MPEVVPPVAALTILVLAFFVGLEVISKVPPLLHTPLMWLDKAQTWELAESLGGRALVDLIVEESHTCYLGERGQRHPWGYGCGTCPACRLRADGYARFTAA